MLCPFVSMRTSWNGVQSLVSRLFVLDFGRLIAAGPLRDVLADAAVRKAYVGDLL